MSGAGTPTQDSNHGDVDMRLTTTSQSIQSVVSAGGKTADTAASSGATLLSGIFHPKRRCRDFDGKINKLIIMAFIISGCTFHHHTGFINFLETIKYATSCIKIF